MTMTPVAGDRVVNPGDPVTIEHILQVIRKRESGGNYTALNKTASASGAYQYIDSTWRTKSREVAGASSYPRAYQAPKAIQDAVAAANVRGILSVTGNHLAGVPVFWYSPAAWNNDSLMNSIPRPDAGNKQTVRQYAEGWLKEYDSMGGTVGGIDATALPPGVARDVLTGDAGWNIPNPLDAVTSVLDAIKVIWSTLSSANTWIRVLKIIGGMIAIGMGLWIITHDRPISSVVDTAKLAAVA
jgi:hypothetical protein